MLTNIANVYKSHFLPIKSKIKLNTNVKSIKWIRLEHIKMADTQTIDLSVFSLAGSNIIMNTKTKVVANVRLSRYLANNRYVMRQVDMIFGAMAWFLKRATKSWVQQITAEKIQGFQQCAQGPVVLGVSYVFLEMLVCSSSAHLSTLACPSGIVSQDMSLP